MSVMPTAYHAVNLFHLMIEGRYGADWREKAAPETIATLADEIVIGFGAIPESPTHTQAGGSFPTVWRFPDGSRVRTGFFGLRAEDGDKNASGKDAAA